MPLHLHPRRPPEIGPLLEILKRHEVEFVLAGSVAALAHGVALSPGDLDVVPRLTGENLKRLALVLEEVEAAPESLGHWEHVDGRKRWIVDVEGPEARAQWSLRVDDITTFDHLFPTLLGDLDIVPEVAGSYPALVERAVWKEICGHRCRVAHVEDLLATIPTPPRPKHRTRVVKLRQLRDSRRG